MRVSEYIPALRRRIRALRASVFDPRRLEAAFWAVVIAGLVPGAVLALIYWPEMEVNRQLGVVRDVPEIRRFELINEARRTLTQIIFGIFGLLALFLTW